MSALSLTVIVYVPGSRCVTRLPFASVRLMLNPGPTVPVRAVWVVRAPPGSANASAAATRTSRASDRRRGIGGLNFPFESLPPTLRTRTRSGLRLQRPGAAVGPPRGTPRARLDPARPAAPTEREAEADQDETSEDGRPHRQAGERELAGGRRPGDCAEHAARGRRLAGLGSERAARSLRRAE